MVDKYSLHLWVGNIRTNDSLLRIHLGKLFQSLKSNSIQTSSLSKVFDFVARKIAKNNSPSNLTSNVHEDHDANETKQEIPENIEERGPAPTIASSN